MRGQHAITDTRCRGFGTGVVDDADDRSLTVCLFIPLYRAGEQSAFAVPIGDIKHRHAGQGARLGKTFCPVF